MNRMNRPKYPDDFTSFRGMSLSDEEIDARVAYIWNNPSIKQICWDEITILRKENTIEILLQNKRVCFIKEGIAQG